MSISHWFIYPSHSFSCLWKDTPYSSFHRWSLPSNARPSSQCFAVRAPLWSLYTSPNHNRSIITPFSRSHPTHLFLHDHYFITDPKPNNQFPHATVPLHAQLYSFLIFYCPYTCLRGVVSLGHALCQSCHPKSKLIAIFCHPNKQKLAFKWEKDGRKQNITCHLSPFVDPRSF